MADWTKNFTAHDWSQIRTTWQTNRDSRHVPKGAGGTAVSIGDAIKRVGAAQAKGLNSFLKELAQLEAKLVKYKAAIAPKAAKPPKSPKDPNYKGFADWIKSDLEAWIKADKEAAKNEAAALRDIARVRRRPSGAQVGLPRQAGIRATGKRQGAGSDVWPVDFRS